MTVAETVVAFLKKNAGKSYCDDCIAKLCEFKRRQQAERVTSPLSLTAEYKRDHGKCTNCGSENKLVIRTS